MEPTASQILVDSVSAARPLPPLGATGSVRAARLHRRLALGTVVACSQRLRPRTARLSSLAGPGHIKQHASRNAPAAFCSSGQWRRPRSQQAKTGVATAPSPARDFPSGLILPHSLPPSAPNPEITPGSPSCADLCLSLFPGKPHLPPYRYSYSDEKMFTTNGFMTKQQVIEQDAQ